MVEGLTLKSRSKPFDDTTPPPLLFLLLMSKGWTAEILRTVPTIVIAHTYSDFLWVVLINTGILLRGLKLCGESRT